MIECHDSNCFGEGESDCVHVGSYMILNNVGWWKVDAVQDHCIEKEKVSQLFDQYAYGYKFFDFKKTNKLKLIHWGEDYDEGAHEQKHDELIVLQSKECSLEPPIAS